MRKNPEFPQGNFGVRFFMSHDVLKKIRGEKFQRESLAVSFNDVICGRYSQFSGFAQVGTGFLGAFGEDED